VLHRQVGGPQVMRDQLAHIDQLAARPNVTVQVLPFTAGAHLAMLGSFTVMQFPDPADRDVVYLEAETGALYLEKPEDVRRYSLMIDYLRAQALGPAESRARNAMLAAGPNCASRTSAPWSVATWRPWCRPGTCTTMAMSPARVPDPTR
jgi:hypothetical protein